VATPTRVTPPPPHPLSHAQGQHAKTTIGQDPFIEVVTRIF
jgi:hypothetical protein